MSEEAQNTVEAVKGTFLSRFNSPFLGAFLISWLVWNHRLVLVLVSRMEVDKRFTYIDETLYPSATHSLWMNLGGPLVSTLLYIFLLPWITEWVHEWNLSRARRLSEASRRSKGEELLGREESERYKADRERRIDQIDNLNQQDRKAKAALAGWRAIAAVRQDIDDPSGVVRDFLLSQKFTLFDQSEPFGSTEVTVSFEPRGDVFLYGRSEFDGVEQWEVRRDQLVLSNRGGEEIVTFKLSGSTGLFISADSNFEMNANMFNLGSS